MRALLPQPVADVDLVTAYATPPHTDGGRPFVRGNMISSLDGAISVGGRSGMLGGRADRRVFQVLRTLADVVLVGAGTARAEGYGPVHLDDDLRLLRTGQGKPAVPVLAVVTGSGAMDWSSPLFTEAAERPIVFSGAGVAGTIRRHAEGVADVVAAGEDRVDPARAVEHLHSAGFRSVLLEGGPGLNADVLRAGLLGELCLTIAPRLVAGSGPRVLGGPELAQPLDLDLVHLLEEDGFLFARLAVPRRS